MADEKIKGPASYFPSIEKAYGRPIAEWKALAGAAAGQAYGAGGDAEG